MEKRIYMLHKNLLCLIFVFTFFGLKTQAQSAIDALRFNSIGQIGTARNIALGGSLGSMGGDMSVTSTNPAGIGRFKSLEFQLSPNVVFGTTKGSFLGNTLEDNHLDFNLSNAGIVFAKVINNNSWKSYSAGIGINRLNHYNESVFLSGTNTNNSLLDLHAAIASNVPANSMADVFPFDAGLTYLGEVLIADTINNQYSSIFGGVAPQQDITISRTGGKYEANISAGGNYEDKIYVGGSIGVPIIKFSETKITAESDENDAIEGFNYFDVRDEFTSSGYGINFKFGVLGIPHEYVRLGAAFHSPSLISFKDQYYTFVNTDFTTVAYEVESPDGEFAYRFVNPMKFIGNAGFLMGKYGFISTEYEVQNPGSAKFKFKSNDADTKREEDIRNQAISDLYQWQHHLKIGMEVKFDPIRIRAGFQYKTSPFADGGDAELTYSGGIGYRGNRFFVDGAFAYSVNQVNFEPYGFESITSGVALLERNRSQVTFTVGVKL
jgi:hypothetical protein